MMFVQKETVHIVNTVQGLCSMGIRRRAGQQL